MSIPDRKIFIVIVHYGDNDVLRRCLQSLQSGTVTPNQIIVVDQNPEPSELGDFKPDAVRFTRPSTNDGYGAGLNFGIGVLFNERPASTDIVVGMNNDVVVYDDAIAQLRAWWVDNPEPALVGVVANEGSRTVYGFGHINPWFGRANLDTKQSLLTGTSYLTYVHGSFMSFPWEVFMKVRGVPEHYFLYWEDVAFSYRVRAAGFPLRLAAQVKIQHVTSPEEMSDDKLYYLVRNGVVCLTSEGPTLWRTWWKIHMWLRTKYHQHWGKQPIVLQALRDAAAGVTGKRSVIKNDAV